MGTRTDWVDCAKAVGIILVVYGHVARGLFNAGIKVPVAFYHLADSVIYSFHMPLFFFISGLFFYGSFLKKGGRDFMLGKVDSVAYPYFIWSIIQGLFEVFLSNYTNGSVTFSDVFRLWEPRAQFWFLYALFFVFSFSAVVFSVVSVGRVSIVLLFSLVMYFGGAGFLGFKPAAFVFDYFVYFVLGVVLSRCDLEKIFSARGVFFVTAIVFVVLQYFYHFVLKLSYFDKGVWSLCLAVVSIFFVVCVSIFVARRGSRFLAYVGASSMAIYILHILFGSGARVVLSSVFGVGDFAIHLVVGCLAGVLMPLVVLKALEVLRFSYAFSAPISKVMEFVFRKAFQRVGL